MSGPVRLYLDEDSSHRRLIRAARSAGRDVLTVAEAGRLQSPDHEQLAFATGNGRVMFTANQRDYARLHSDYLREGRTHAGIIVCTRQLLPPSAGRSSCST